MKMLALLFSFLITTLITLTAYAGGDKVRASSQILEPGTNPCVFMLPPGIDIDIDTCSATATDEDGNTILSCPFGDVLVLCTDLSDNPGNSGSSSGKN